MSRIDHLEQEHWRAFEGVEPKDVDFAELARMLDLGRWTFPAFLVGAFGTAAGIVTLLAAALGLWFTLPSNWIPVAVAVIAAFLPLAWFTGRRVREGLVAEDVMHALVLREWSTGQPLLPATVRWPRHWEDARIPPPPTDRELGRMRLAKRITQSRAMYWLPRAMIIAIPVGLASMALAPAPLRNILFSAGVWIPVLLILGPFFAWFALAMATTRLEGRIWMLQEYQKASGRDVLPEDLAAYSPR